MERARPLQHYFDLEPSKPKRTVEDYTIAWICALPTPKWSASRYLFDTFHPDLSLPQHVQHQYAYGVINGHNVVMGCLPAGRIGEIPAALVLNEMLSTFPNISFALMVGIGGGVWSEQHDVRLGDVVVSYPSKDLNHSGVKEYEYDKAVQDQGFKPTSSLNMPQTNVLAGLSKIRSCPSEQSEFVSYLESFELNLDRHTRRPIFERPSEPDVLFEPHLLHEIGNDDCSDCEKTRIITRTPRQSELPVVHYGLIASGKKVIKNALERDRIWNDFDCQVLCFEMEAAGVVSQSKTCLVIRGICDYCDSHKNKIWQPYAAAAAASWAKEYLRNVAPIALKQERSTEHDNYGTMIRYQNDQLVKSRISEQDFEATVNRISSYDPLITLRRLKHRRVQNTTEWLAHNVAFTQWQAPTIDQSKELLIYGKVGGGKTLVMQRLVEILLEPSPLNPDTVVLHWFCQHPNCQALHAVRSFAKQIIQHLQKIGKECPVPVSQELSNYFGERNRTTTALDVVDYVITPLLSKVRDFTLCIDGIDEFSIEEREKLRVCLTHILSAKSGRVVITTQDMNMPRQLHAEHFRIRLGSDTIDNDIKIFVEDRLKSLASTGSVLADKDLYNKVKTSLLAQAEGMFLWVKLMLDLLEDCESAKQVMQALKNMPDGLEATYLRCLNRKKNGHYICRPQILRWVAVASEPLTVKQLQEALAIDKDTGTHSAQDEIPWTSISRAGVGLIVLDEHDHIVSPIHRSVRQYLFSTSLQQSLEKGSIHSDSPLSFNSYDERSATLESAHISIAHITHCTTGEVVLRRDVQPPPVLGMIPSSLQKAFKLQSKRPIDTSMIVRQSKQPAARTDFLTWAIRTWAEHTRHIRDTDALYSKFRELGLQLNKTENVFPWCKAKPMTMNSLLHNMLGYAVAHDHFPLFQLFIENQAILPAAMLDLPLPGNDLMIPMHLACKMGFKSMAIVLCNFHDPDKTCQQTGKTALHYAAENGDVELISIVLELMLPSNARTRAWSSANYASFRRIDNTGMTALHIAARMGNTAALEVFNSRGILDKIGLDHKQRGDQKSTMITLAVRHGHVETVRLLLSLSFPGEEQGHLALHEALLNKDQAMAREILNSKLMPRFDAGTCLSISNSLNLAVDLGFLDIMELLLETYSTNATELVQGSRNVAASAFPIALKAGELTVIKALARYADANSPGRGSDRPPLLMAVDMRRYDIFTFLLSIDGVRTHEICHVVPDPLTKRPCITAWTAAIEISKLDPSYLQSLLQHAMNLDGSFKRYSYQEKYGRASALVTAAAAGEVRVLIEMLRKPAVQTNLIDMEFGRTSLSWAVTHFDDNVVRHLLEAEDVDVNAKDESGRTALSWAVQRGRPEIIQMLLASEQLSIDERDEENATALARAIMNNDHDVVEVLLGKAGLLMVNEVVYLEWTALSWAAAHCDLEMVDLLCDCLFICSDVLALMSGRSALSRAAERGSQDIVERIKDLKEREAGEVSNEYFKKLHGDLDVKDHSPLLYAISSGNLATVRSLIPGPNEEAFHPHWNGGHAFRWAVRHATLEIVEELVKTEPHFVSNQVFNGMSALNLAVKHGRGDIAKYLLQHTMNDTVAMKDDDGRGILYWSVDADLAEHVSALHLRLNLYTYTEGRDNIRTMWAKYGRKYGKVKHWINANPPIVPSVD